MTNPKSLAIRCACLGTALALLLAGAPALADGKAKVTLRDGKGVVINGKVTAKKDALVKECDSAAGTCTLIGLAPGKWVITAKSAGGATGGPKTVTVEEGKTASAALTLTAPAQTVTIDSSGTSREGTTGQVAGTSTVKNLAAGTTRRLTGTCKDEQGVLVNGTVTVMKDAAVLGESKTAAGKYSVYDVAPGSYKLVFKTSGGKTKTRTVTVPATGEAVANFQF
jgi:hypothetical protein